MDAQPPAAFVGRQEHFAVLDSVVRAARSDDPQLVVVGGEAGVGKTRLVEHFAGWLGDAGWRVLRGNCVHLGTEGLPLAAPTALLRDLVRQVGADRVAGLLPGAGAMLRLLPELAERTEELPEPARLFEIFAALLRRLSIEQPVLLVVDDLHWADRSTRQLLGVLARTLGAARVVVVTAYRSDDLDRRHPLRSFLADVGRLPGVHQVELERFSRSETAELVAGVLGGPAPAEMVRNVFGRSGGNAFFAEELTRADTQCGDARMPGTLRDLLLDRVEQLDDAARRVVRVAAVGDRSLSHGLLSVTTGLPGDALLAALRTAVDIRVLVAEPDSDAYRFHHALLREAVLDDMLPAERVGLHRACAEALAQNPALVSLERLPAELAFHWYSAGDHDRALPALLAAAAAAEEIHAFTEQWHILLRALEVWPRVTRAPGVDRLDVWEKAVGAGVWAGEAEHAVDLVERALAELDPAAEPARAAMLHALRAHGLLDLGRDSEDAVATALELLPAAPTRQRASVLHLCGGRMHARGARSIELSEEAADIAAQLGDEALEARARTSVGVALAGRGAYDAALAVFGEQRAKAESLGDPTLLARVQNNIAHVLGVLGRYDEAGAAARAGLVAGRRAGLSRTLGVILGINLAEGLYATGGWDEADRVCAVALERDPVSVFAAHMHAIRGRIALARGDTDRAREQERLATGVLAATDASRPHLPVSTLRAQLALHEHRLDDARKAVAAALPMFARPDDCSHAWQLLTTGARIEAHRRLRARTVGDAPSGCGFVDDLRAAAGKLSTDTPLFAAYAAQFELEITDGADWPVVVTAWDRLGAPYAAAYARLRGAQQATRTGRRADAEHWLRTAAGQARELSAASLLAEIEITARSAHVALTDPEPSAASDDLRRLGLTERETEVLRLVTAGRSNRQIAERLYISPKTASVHVSRILDKLAVTTRGEAAATAYRLRLFDGDLDDELSRGA